MNSTSFRIWAIVEKEKGNDLPDIKTGKVIFFYFCFEAVFLIFYPQSVLWMGLRKYKINENACPWGKRTNF